MSVDQQSVPSAERQPAMPDALAEQPNAQQAGRQQKAHEMSALIAGLREAEETEVDEVLTRLRMALPGGERAIIASRNAVAIPAEEVATARTNIRTELSRRAGVLGSGEAASASTNFGDAGLNGTIETNATFGAAKYDTADDRSESRGPAVFSLKDLAQKAPEQRTAAQEKAALQQKIADAQAELSKLDDADLDAFAENIKTG